MVREQVHAWAAEHPQTLRFFGDLNSRNIPWGIFSGLAVHLLCASRPTADTDLLIPNGRLEDVAALLPDPHITHKLVTVRAADGIVLRYEVDELTAMLDSEVQIMQPTTPVTNGFHSYQMSLTTLAADHRSCYTVGGTDVYMAHPFDTLAIKAILQRGTEQAKHDSFDSRAIAVHCDPISSYPLLRAQEIGLDGRTFNFMHACGAAALLPCVEPGYSLAA